MTLILLSSKKWVRKHAAQELDKLQGIKHRHLVKSKTRWRFLLQNLLFTDKSRFTLLKAGLLPS